MLRTPPRSTPLSLHDALPISDAGGVEAVRHEGEILERGQRDAVMHHDPVGEHLEVAAPRVCVSFEADLVLGHVGLEDRKSTRLNSSHGYISYAVFCLKKKKKQ